MTLHGTLRLHPAHRVGPVRRRTFGSLTGFGPLEIAEAVVLHEDDPYTVNTAEDPDRVVPQPLEGVHLTADDAGADGPATLTADLPPISWAMIRLQTTA